MDILEAKRILGIPADACLTVRLLKTQFRIGSRIHHPDVGGDASAFVLIKSAYDVLLSLDNLATDTILDLLTMEGQHLSDLGKGYPLTVSAMTCKSCEGRGWKSFHKTAHAPCSHCEGTGLIRYPCRHCNGTGKYKHPNTGKEIGQCRGCKGSGWFYPFNKRASGFFYDHFPYVPGTDKEGVPCRFCHGTREDPYRIIPKEVLYYSTCTVCEGIGEIKLKNPVLPRGYFTSGQ